MRRLIIFFLLLTHFCFGQKEKILYVQNVEGHPLADAHLITDGHIDITNIQGSVTIRCQNISDTIIITHLGYWHKKVAFSDLNYIDTIKLTIKSTQLNSIDINANLGESFKKPKYSFKIFVGQNKGILLEPSNKKIIGLFIFFKNSTPNKVYLRTNIYKKADEIITPDGLVFNGVIELRQINNWYYIETDTINMDAPILISFESVVPESKVELSRFYNFEIGGNAGIDAHRRRIQNYTYRVIRWKKEKNKRLNSPAIILKFTNGKYKTILY